MFKSIFFFFALALSVEGADILKLVGMLDRNDTTAFIESIQTINDANSAREDNNKTILMYACWVGNIGAVKHLVAKGADINAEDSGGATALHLAVWKNHTPIALYLIENGASASVISKDGMTPLDVALMRENQEIVKAIKKMAPKLKKLL
ncbi:MAG: ankyrin repeat domain-containing protein [Epsilonproteobacteria bacterium]|nr:ankyrin repeat domain-containing protein [Campylobacterota bacterium]